jgi:aspartyl-tRNA(Asn)/glutamyl-tRNA(Gln) amidotransferase subunit C
MTISTAEIKKIAHLARLNLNAEDETKFTEQLSKILSLIEQMSEVDTSNIAPVAHSIELSQRLREDVVSEENQREAFQKIAPAVEVGLYLVPKVIE